MANMGCYRVVIFDERKNVLISKIVTDEGPKEDIARRIGVVIGMHGAPFTVSVTDYEHETLSVLGFMDCLDSALSMMSLKSE